MPTTLSRPLIDAVLTTDGTTVMPAPLDLSEWPLLEIVVRVTQAGVAAPTADGETPATPALRIQHAPTGDASDPLDLPTPVAVDLTVAATTWVHVPYFTAFLYISVTGHLEQPATLTVEILGKR